MFLCIFGYPKLIPGSVEALLGLWAWAVQPLLPPGWILGLENKNDATEAPVPHSLGNSPCWGLVALGSAQSPAQVLELFPVVPVASGCRFGGF